MIAGNHDLSFDIKNQEQVRRNFPIMDNVDIAHTKAMLTNCIYLEDSGCQLFGYKIWGSPWQPAYFDWAFNLPRG